MSKRAGDPGYAGGWCIHYRYNRDPKVTTCEAGVEYDTLPKLMAEKPCFLLDGKSRPNAGCCAKLRRPTPEEITAHVDWQKKRTTSLLNAIARCFEHSEGKKNVAGSIFCDACEDGVIRYTVHYNGHIHGHCSTPNCLSWMQ